MRPWSDCFRQADLDPRLAEGLVRRALGRVKRLADRGILPSDSPYAQIAQVRDTADERMELAQMIGQALAAGDQGRARRLIGIGGTMFGHAPMVAAVEARAREAQLATLKAEQDRWSEDPVAEQYPTLEMEHDPDRQRRTLTEFEDLGELVRAWRAGNVSWDYGTWGPDPEIPVFDLRRHVRGAWS
jgi:hypothetical protein